MEVAGGSEAAATDPLARFPKTEKTHKAGCSDVPGSRTVCGSSRCLVGLAHSMQKVLCLLSVTVKRILKMPVGDALRIVEWTLTVT